MVVKQTGWWLLYETALASQQRTQFALIDSFFLAVLLSDRSKCSICSSIFALKPSTPLGRYMAKPHGPLVLVSSTPHSAYTSSLSTRSSSWAL